MLCTKLVCKRCVLIPFGEIDSSSNMNTWQLALCVFNEHCQFLRPLKYVTAFMSASEGTWDAFSKT